MRYHENDRWVVYGKRADFYGIAQRFGIDPVTARVLRNRYICTDEEISLFLHGDLGGLSDAALLPDAETAAALLAEDIRAGARIRIVGDYDIDGVCAAYILMRGLSDAGAAADCVIPERIRDGYGINIGIVEKAARDGVQTILTCDNGIAAVSEMQRAKELGMRVVVTDHHSIRKDASGREILPPADAVVDPKRLDSRYPTAEICGAVVAWKLLGLLYRRMGLPEEKVFSFLEFAAVATVGDIMPLKGENRIIVREGLRKLERSPVNRGLRALIEAQGLSGKHLTAYHIGFVIGPCINAGGRLETAEEALRLFLSETEEEAQAGALHLKELNDERKLMTEAGQKKAEELTRERFLSDRVLVLYVEGLHESLAGIVAGRIRETFSRPAIVFTDAADGMLKGSGRSTEAYDMFAHLCRRESLLEKFGGHPMAAGLTVKPENLEALRKGLNEDCGLTGEDLTGRVMIDAAMPFSYITERLVRELDALEPFGNGNERPLFAVKNAVASPARVLGKNRNVLSFRLREDGGGFYDGLMFGDAPELKEKLDRLMLEKGSADILYYPQISEYMGRRTLSIHVEDFR